jgi:hypothetical protein
LRYGTPTVSVDGYYERDADGLISALEPIQGAQGKVYNWNHRITLVDYEWGKYWECHDHYSNQIIRFNFSYRFGNPKIYFLILKPMPQIYKKKGSPALFLKHWRDNLLIPFADGAVPGGDLFKSLFAVEKYSDLPRIDVDELPYPISTYSLTTV